ncbi:MAG: hypothetical protein AAF439_12760 [Pseudomonadota bacterium]
MPGLFDAIDGAERRFLIYWVGMWLVGLLLYFAVMEVFSIMSGTLGDTLEEELYDIYEISELIATLIVTLIGAALPWIIIAPLYRRPSLANWLTWALVALFVGVLLIAIVGSALLEPNYDPIPREDVPIGAFLAFYLIELVLYSGVIIAYLFVSWRVSASLLLATVLGMLLAGLLGVSTVTEEMIQTLEDPVGDTGWGEGIYLADIPPMLAEVVIWATLSGIAIIIGFRWQHRDVESRIFE